MGQSELPLASGAKHAKCFERCGWTLEPRRGRGKHYILTKPGNPATLSIPDHVEVSRVLLAKQIVRAGLTIAEYLAKFK